MIRYIFNKMLIAMQNRYNYDVSYMQDILNSDIKAFFKFSGFQTMSSHTGNLPAAALFAARLRSIISEDCGPCTQLLADMALEANIESDIVQAIIESDLNKLPEEIALVVRFTELVLNHDPKADELRSELLALWGLEGLIAVSFGISTSRVYPTLKYSLGYGKACSRVQVGEGSLIPRRAAPLS